MLSRCGIFFLLWIVGDAAWSASHVLLDGDLRVEILTNNGALGSVQYEGVEFFRRGNASSVADFGVMIDNDPASFVANTIYGDAGLAVTQINPVTYSANYHYQSKQLQLLRSYQLLAGLNTLRVTMELTNNGAPTVAAVFDTFDPDQGVDLGQGNATRNKVNALPEAIWGMSRIDTGSRPLTVIAGSGDLRTTVSAGGFFSLFDGGDVVDFFDFPFDGEDALADEGLHIGLRTPLAGGQTTVWHYDLTFGATPTQAEDDFLAAVAIPEPGVGLLSLPFVIFTGLGLRSIGRNRNRAI